MPCTFMSKFFVCFLPLLAQFANLHSQNQQVADSLIAVYREHSPGDTSTYELLNNIAFNLNRPEDIVTYAKILQNQALEVNNNFYLHSSLIHLGNAYRLLGNYELAFDYYFQSLDLSISKNIKTGIGISYTLIADAYSVIGDSNSSLEFYKKGLQALKEDGNRVQLASAILNTGDEFLKSNQPDSAVGYFLEASLIFNQEKYLAGKAYSIGNLGLVYARQKKYQLAEATLKEAIDILIELGDYYGISVYLITMSEVYSDLSLPEIALEYANLSYSYAYEHGLKEQIRDASLRLSEIYEEINKTGEAFSFLKTYLQYRDSLKNESIIYRMSEIRREHEIRELSVKQKTSEGARKDYSNELGESYPRYYALLIGVSDYRHNDERLNDLRYPVKDAERVARTLAEHYIFDEKHTLLVTNPTRSDIINAFEALAVTMTEKDNLLVFYAGHGVWDEKLKIGYWLPTDARSDSKVNWISNSTIRDYISGLPAKHTLLISDACFSGSIFSSRALNSTLDDYAFSRVYKLSSRNAMTSGTLETVPDQSEFTKYLIKRLEDNKKEYFTARQLFHDVETAVINNTNNIPQYGVIQNAGDEGGSFVFVKSN